MDIDALLDPISDAQPSGEDLSFSVEFDAIQEKRREEDPTLDQGEWVRALKAADWPGVASQCADLLKKRSKDLRLVTWLFEARSRLDGFSGLADGLTLCGKLCDMFWDNLHPQPEDGDFEQRVGNLTVLLRQIPELSAIAPALVGGNKRYSLRDIDGARSLQQSIAKGAIDAATVADKSLLTMDEVARVRASTPKDFFITNLAHVKRAGAALAHLEAVIDKRLGAGGPGFTAARKALEDAIGGVERLGRESGALAPADSGGDDVGTSAEGSPAAGGGARGDSVGQGGGSLAGPLQTRAQALRQLRLVAEFFRRTEPHSPVAYLADKAAKWGDMPLHEWLRVVLKDQGALAHVEELIGVEPPPSH